MTTKSLVFRIDQYARETCRISRKGEIVLGVSGGADSLCMLDALHRAGYALRVAHFDHGLRSDSSAESARVGQLAAARGLSFQTQGADTGRYARENRLSIEEAARILRYRFLLEVAEERGASAVAVAHTADDQVETVFMHLLRGSGLAGLRGMRPRIRLPEFDSAVPIVRPLLGFWRSEVVQYCRENGLKPVVDPSNQDRRYLRNRIRHDMLPLLEQNAPHLGQRILQMAEILAEDETVLDDLVERARQRVETHSSATVVGLDRQRFSDQPVALQRRLVRNAVSQLLPGLRDLDFEAVERARSALLAPASGQRADLAGGLQLFVSAGQGWIAAGESHLPARGWPQLISPAPQELPLPGALHLEAGWRLLSERRTGRPEISGDPYRAVFDADGLRQPLLVRGRSPGDRFQPLGMNAGSIKVADLMINEKIPRHLRQRWPLVCSQDQILWLPGLRQSRLFRVTDQTRNCVYLEMRLPVASSQK